MIRSLRIIAGTLKGRRLLTPSWGGLRPTSDKLRETLFNVIAPRVAGARVLDGYAGTGAIGIEAISRGASHVTFVDRDRRARALIADNLARCGIERGCAIIRASFDRRDLASDQRLNVGTSVGTRVGRSVSDNVGDNVGYSIVVLDPPYETQPEQVIASTAELLAADGLLVLEHASRQGTPALVGPLVRVRELRSGDSALSFYARIDS